MSNVQNIKHSFLAAAKEFENAWENTRNTRFELPAPDVNKVVSERYEVGKPVHLTRSMVWDMELKKAWNPAKVHPLCCLSRPFVGS